MSKIASRDDFVTAKTRQYAQAYVGGLNRHVRVQSMTEGERMALLKKYGTDEDGSNLSLRAAVIAQCVVDEDDDRIFTDADVKTISEWRTHVVDAIYKAIDQLCEIDLASEEQRLEDSLKNSETTPCVDSPSAWRINADMRESTTCLAK